MSLDPLQFSWHKSLSTLIRFHYSTLINFFKICHGNKENEPAARTKAARMPSSMHRRLLNVRTGPIELCIHQKSWWVLEIGSKAHYLIHLWSYPSFGGWQRFASAKAGSLYGSSFLRTTARNPIMLLFNSTLRYCAVMAIRGKHCVNLRRLEDSMIYAT